MKKPSLSTIFKALAVMAPLSGMGYVAFDNRDMIFPQSTDTTIDDLITDILEESSPSDIVENNPSVIPVVETACNFTEEKFQDYCHAALRAQETTGFDALIMMYKIGMETGFRPLPQNDLKAAQGPLQIQPAYLIDKLFQHGRDLPFMLDENNTEFKKAMGILLDDPRILTAQGQRELATIMHDSFKKSDFSDYPHLKILSDARHNMDFSMQLVAMATMRDVPEAAYSNFNNYGTDEMVKRQEISLEAYFIHNAGLNGARYQMELMTNSNYSELRPADRASVEEAIKVIQAEFNYPDISVDTLIRNAEANPAVFTNISETQYGCISYDLSNTMSLHMGSFLHTLNTAHTISLFHGHSGIEEDPDLPFVDNIDIVSATFHSDTVLTSSPRPMPRPEIIVGSIPETDITDKAQLSWHQMNCGVQDTSRIIRTSPIPPRRPATITIASNL